jgi:hypothetical protein
VFTARQLVNGSFVQDAAPSGGQRQELAVIGEARIGADGTANPDTGVSYAGSATNWFLAASTRSVRVAPAPQVRSWPLDSGEWGLGFDVAYDVGAYAGDYRGLYKSAGA